jgi:hypothetical protein
LREEADAIATLFIANIPNDMAEREFINIFRFAMGFLAATLKDNVNKNDPLSKKQKVQVRNVTFFSRRFR